MEAIIKKDEFEKEVITDLETLSERCDEIDVRKQASLVQEIVLGLKATLRAHKENAVALAANQIGYNYRIFVIRFGENDYRTFINPIITNAKGLTLNKESCLSIPGKEYIRPRNTEIEVMYQTPLGKAESRKMFGLAAFVFQHELDHLDGLNVSDIGLEIDDDFRNASEEEQNQLLDKYLEALDLKQKELKEEIDNDEELKQQSDAIDFMQSVIKGETILGETISETKREHEEKKAKKGDK